MSKSTWRPKAQAVINRVAAECHERGITDLDEIIKAINAAYPWGERAYHPYKIWLDELRRFRKRYGEQPKPAQSAGIWNKLDDWNNGRPISGTSAAGENS